MIPKVSIIVPVYKTEKYLDRCVNSLVNQTLKQIEIILVEDGSPDNCPKICDDWAKKNMKITVIHKKNGGLGLARNTGIEIAKGKYIAFVDSDDFVDKNMYEKLCEEAERDNLDTCFCRFRKYYESGKIEPILESNQKKIWSARENVDYFLMNMLGSTFMNTDRIFSFSVCKAIYSLDLIKKKNIRFISEHKIACEDLFFHIDYLSQAKKIAWLPKHFYYYFHRTQSITTTYNEKNYRLFKLAMKELSIYLDKYFTYDYYKNYYYAQILLWEKEIITKELKRKNISYSEKRKILKRECNEPLLKLEAKFILKHKFKLIIYLFAIKYKLVDIVYLLNKLNESK